MKIELIDDFVNMLKKYHSDVDWCASFGSHTTLNSIKKGDTFFILPHFAFPNSRDSFTLKNATDEYSPYLSNGNWIIKNTICLWSDKYKIISIRKNQSTKGSSIIRVKNIRTNVDFDIINPPLGSLVDSDISYFYFFEYK